MAVNNATILNKIWLSGTNDFQQRIPEPTQSNISKVAETLLDPMNKMYYNQFIDALIMRIGDTFVHQQTFKNPLSVFKKSRMMYGNTLQEIIPHWIRAHAYEDDAEDVFKMARPDVSTWYHSQNRRDRYDITINDEELRTAFTDEFGLNKLVSGLLQVPINSDEYDEYRIMLQLIAFYEQNWGFYKQGLTSTVSTKETGEDFLVAVRELAGMLAFPSARYNALGLNDVPVFAKPNELVLLITPRVQANIDVRNLAAAFNRDDAEIKYRVVMVDEFPIANCEAILTTDDFFMCKDTVYRTESIYNPKTLGINYFLHHWGVYSVSPVVPAIAFVVGDSTGVPVVTQSVTGLNATIDNATPAPGDECAITLTLQGSISPDTKGVKVAPDAATYEVTVTRGDNAINSPATRVDEYGILHVSSRLENGDVISVVCTSTYNNPSGTTTPYTATVTATVTV